MPEDDGTSFLVIGQLFAKRSEQMVTSSTAKRLSINVIDAAINKYRETYYSAQSAAFLRIDRYRHGQE